MFTGIITDTTEIVDQKFIDTGLTLVFNKPKTWTDLELGESVATNGVCLTVAKVSDDTYTCDLIPETLKVTTYGQSVPKSVNLERSLNASDRLSGVFVQGHVDDVGKVVKVQSGDDYRIIIEFSKEFDKYVVYKGTIIVNGVALTVASVKDNALEVALVPYTLKHTTLAQLKADELVNLEFDMIGKYVANFMEKSNAKS